MCSLNLNIIQIHYILRQSKIAHFRLQKNKIVDPESDSIEHRMSDDFTVIQCDRVCQTDWQCHHNGDTIMCDTLSCHYVTYYVTHNLWHFMCLTLCHHNHGIMCHIKCESLCDTIKCRYSHNLETTNLNMCLYYKINLINQQILYSLIHLENGFFIFHFSL